MTIYKEGLWQKLELLRKQDLKGKTKEIPADDVSTVNQGVFKSQKDTNWKNFNCPEIKRTKG